MEQILLPVHTNQENTLTIIPHFIEESFRLPEFGYGDGTCLYNQFAFIASKFLGRTHEQLHCLWKWFNEGQKGHTIQGLIRGFQKYHKHLKITSGEYRDINHTLEDVMRGQPALMVIRGFSDLWYESNDKSPDIYQKPKNREPGECVKFKNHLLPKNIKNPRFHAFLIVGYDKAGDFVILRDSSHDYGYKGFIRIKKSRIEKNPKGAYFFSFVFGK